MHSDRKTADLPQRPADVRPIGVHDLLRQFRPKKGLQPKLEQVSILQKRVATRCGAVPNDLDRIAQADGEMEVLDVISEVFEMLRRSGRTGEMPSSLQKDRLTTTTELRMAMKSMQDAQSFMEDVDWHSDAMLVLRAVLSAADEKLRELRRRE